MYKVRKIYYDKVTGEIVWNVSYNQETEVNFDRDYETINVLNERSKESLKLMVLKDGEFEDDFSQAQLVKVNVMLKAQVSASDERADFHEEVLTEIIMSISQ